LGENEWAAVGGLLKVAQAEELGSAECVHGGYGGGERGASRGEMARAGAVSRDIVLVRKDRVDCAPYIPVRAQRRHH
jgi:hypothetical protein